ncbi:MAG: beta-ketoacyl synthase [Candidatus Binatia bacterium]
MTVRVVITGLGVVAPNAVGLADFEAALREGRSGIRHIPAMAELGFGCQVAGVPPLPEDVIASHFTEIERRAMNSSHLYASIAALEAWADAGLPKPHPDDDAVHWDTGAVIGTGIGGMDTIVDRLVDQVRAGKVRRLGTTLVEQIMASGVSARVAGLLGLGNQVTSNSSACTTGTEAVVEASRTIRNRLATRMLAGASEGASIFTWAGFDSMRVLMRKSNDAPERASRPLSASAGGFVPGSGAGMLVLESLDTARARGARIYGEVLGGAVNCGGQRMGGSMTSPNPTGMLRCIRAAIAEAGVAPREIDVINGHLTATGADPNEMNVWGAALERPPGQFPLVTATKSMIGHALGAAGAIECVGAMLMLHRRFVHPCRNCEDLHPEVAAYAEAIPQEMRPVPSLNVLAKAGFGFGDVNAAIILRRWEGE